MTISTSASVTTLMGNGSTTVFSFGFIYSSSSDIQVIYTDSIGTLTTLLPSQYTITLNPPATGQLWGVGGTVTYPKVGTPIASGTQLTIKRIMPLTQGVSISNQGNFSPQVIEAALDKLCMEIQQVSARFIYFAGDWAPGNEYTYGDVVVDGANGLNTGNFYGCTIPNTSSTWASDLAAGYWVLEFDIQPLNLAVTTCVTAAGTAAAEASTATTQAGIATGAASTATTQAGIATGAASTATTQAGIATSAAADASLFAAGLIATSTTSLLIATGSKSFTTQASKKFDAGQFILAVSAANSSNYMHGQVISYSGTSLVVNVLDIGGSGTFADWNLSVSGSQGAVGATGPTGSIPIAAAGGTVNAITATYSPALTLSDLTTCMIISAGANTSTTPTFSPNGLAAKTITARGGSALYPGDISSAGFVAILEYNLANTRWELLNPKGSIYTHGSDIVAASTLNLDNATGDIVDITGNTGITAITLSDGKQVITRFTGTPIITNSANLVCPSNTNYTAAAGDYITWRGYSAGIVRAVSGLKADGSPYGNSGYSQDFRLTLTSATPVTTSDVTGATTIYCTPYKGNKIALFDGTNWNTRTSAEFSLALGTLTSAKPYDIFCYDNAGVPTLEFLVWTNDTTRATALAYTSGILRKSGDGTRRYLGTFYTTATTTTEDSVANRYLYNYYNRVAKDMRRVETTASWAYTTATIRQANGSTSNQLNFLQGVAEDLVIATLKTTAENTNVSVELQSGIGLDITNNWSNTANTEDLTKVSSSRSAFHSNYYGIPSAGRHFLSWNEYSTATGTTTWYGSSNRSLLSGTVFV